MKGKLYGVGTGPGDPELLTVKAVKTMQKCDVIAVPKTVNDERTAFSIVEKYLDGKELLECRFTMDKDAGRRREARQMAAGEIIKFLDKGKDVAFVCLGDPTTYSTYMYVHEIIISKGFAAEIVPGITSYTAASAAFGIALCEGGETLTLIPARHSDNIDELLDYPGNKVIMKSGENLLCVLKKLKGRGYGERTKIACRVSMDGQHLYTCIEEFEKSYEISPEAGYFTLAIVK